MSLGGISQTATEGAKKGYAPMNGVFPAKVMEVAFDKAAKNGNSVYNEVTFVITDGEFKGRRIWERFIHTGASTKAIEVGRERLKRLVGATLGQNAINSVLEGEKSLDELVDRPVTLEVETKGAFTNAKKFMTAN